MIIEIIAKIIKKIILSFIYYILFFLYCSHSSSNFKTSFDSLSISTLSFHISPRFSWALQKNYPTPNYYLNFGTTILQTLLNEVVQHCSLLYFIFGSTLISVYGIFFPPETPCISWLLSPENIVISQAFGQRHSQYSSIEFIIGILLDTQLNYWEI